MDPSMEPDTSAAAEEPPKKKIRRVFNNKWLQDPLFKDWLQGTHGGDMAFCSICTVSLSCKRSILAGHAISINHIDNYNCKNINKKSSADSVAVTSRKENICINIKMKKFEIELSALFADRNFALSGMDYLIPIINRLIDGSEIAKKLVLTRKKTQKIIVNVLGTAETVKITDILRESKFSLMINESTTIANKKLLCVSVKFMKPDRKIVTQCFDMIDLDARNCSASVLFAEVESIFQKQQIPLSNIISFASDNMAVMIGKNDSFVTRLKQKNSNLIVLNCVCHSSALIASKACAKLPGVICQFLNSVSSYFSSSSKRSSDFEDFQNYFGVETQKILKASTTRWLSLHQCIVRLLKNWIPLSHFFHLQSAENPTSSVVEIHNNFNDSEIYAYLLFLKFTLDNFNEFNALFQSHEIKIHVLAERSRWLLEQMTMCFLEPNASNDIAVNSIIPDNILPLLSINVGDKCQKFLNDCPSEIVQKVKSNCLEFFKTAAFEIINRLPCYDEFLSDLKFLNPEIALSEKARSKFKKLDALCTKCDLMDLASQINIEWSSLPFFLEDAQKTYLFSLTLENMWSEIFKLTHSNGVLVFCNLKKLVDSVLILPHSNAEAERAFSNVTDIVTKKRNRIGNDTEAAMCKVRSSLRANGLDCISFRAEPLHLTLYNKNFSNK